MVFALVSIAHLPKDSLTALFDKNSAIQFLTATFLGSLIGFILMAKRFTYRLPSLLVVLIALLMVSVSISLALSANKYQGLTGDTFRYNGVASLFFLITIGLLHTLFSFEQFLNAIKSFLAATSLVSTLALLQFLNVVTLPGIQGTVTGTFGNLDFLSAYLGTSFPLWIIAFINSKPYGKALTILGAALSGFIIYLAGAKQGYLDLALTAVGVTVYLLYSKISYRYFGQAMSIPLKTSLFSIAILLWLEFIFALPFANLNIPHISDDPQVAIRGVMWLAAFNVFRSHFFFGVGPDQYGDYYEQFRTVNSVVILPSDSSNDAHSAPLQILATYGFVGAIIFFVLIVMVIRALLILHRNRPEIQRSVAALALFLFVYLTNAAVSPTVLANKYLVWAVGAFVIAYAAYESPRERFSYLTDKSIKPLVGILTSVLILTTVVFSTSLYRFNSYGEFNQTTKGDYQRVNVDNYLPCQYYFPDLLRYTGIQYTSEIKALSKARIETSPRCYSAIIRLAGIAAEENNLRDLRKYIYQLIEIAPARREVLDAATYYALKAKDKELEATVREQFAKMGITILDVAK
jgi:O-antigen ligase